MANSYSKIRKDLSREQVVIASFVGAKGLGLNLKIALNSLKIGKAAEAGFCIVLIAVILDRFTKAWANKQVDYFENLTFFQTRAAFSTAIPGLSMLKGLSPHENSKALLKIIMSKLKKMR